MLKLRPVRSSQERGGLLMPPSWTMPFLMDTQSWLPSSFRENLFLRSFLYRLQAPGVFFGFRGYPQDAPWLFGKYASAGNRFPGVLPSLSKHPGCCLKYPHRSPYIDHSVLHPSEASSLITLVQSGYSINFVRGYFSSNSSGIFEYTSTISGSSVSIMASIPASK